MFVWSRVGHCRFDTGGKADPIRGNPIPAPPSRARRPAPGFCPPHVRRAIQFVPATRDGRSLSPRGVVVC